MSRLLTQEEFIEKARQVHGDKYDYSKSFYTKSSEKIVITCPNHGDFKQCPNNHFAGKGCPKCGTLRTSASKIITNGEIIRRFKKIHGDTYDYSYVNYINCKHKVKIRCIKHNIIFEQLSDNHIKGQGCPKCSGNNKKTLDDFKNVMNRSIYDYSKTVYNGIKNKIEVVCPIHGSFWQTAENHFYNNHKCPKCSRSDKSTSKNENEIYNLIRKYYNTSEQSNRIILKGKEIDIYIPELKIGIEYNGLYWHSDLYYNNNYHLNKLKITKKEGIKLIQIFSDEWLYKQDIVKSRLLNIIGKTPNKIYARKCIIKEVSSKDCSIFLDQNHIQGKLGAKVRLGLYYNDELVSLMTFGNLRKNLGQSSKEGSYELLRFCNKLNTTVIGGASKLFKYFINNYNPNTIISYADRRWSEGNLYYNLGFNLIGESRPNYFYINLKNTNIREGRFKYRKDILIKQGFDHDKSEHEIMKEREYARIYDCGVLKFEYKKREE